MILDGATIEFESSNPIISSFIDEDNVNRVPIIDVCNYLEIGDSNFSNSEVISKIEKIIELLGEDYMPKLEGIVSRIGFRDGMVDAVYNDIILDREINRVSGNLENLFKKKYGNTDSLQG